MIVGYCWCGTKAELVPLGAICPAHGFLRHVYDQPTTPTGDPRATLEDAALAGGHDDDADGHG